METVISVKIVPLGEAVKEVGITSGTTIEEALRIAGITLNGRAITLNDADARVTTPITEDDSVVALSTKMKGGC